MLEETRGEYHSFRDLMSFGTKPQPAIYKSLTSPRGEALFNAIEAALDNIGFRRLSFLGQGEFSLAFYATDGMVLRLASAREPERINHPAIAKPIETLIVSADHDEGPTSRCKLEILPYFNSKLTSRKHVMQLYAALEASGYEVDDLAKKGNVVVIPHNGGWLPLLLDIGLLKPIKGFEVNEEALKRILAPWEGAQEAYDSRIVTHTITDVVSAENLRRIEESLTGGERTSSIVAALKRGLYPSEIEHVSHSAILDSEGNCQSWSEYFHKGLENYRPDPNAGTPKGRGKGRE